MKKRFAGIGLRRLREERGLTQQALARAIGISPSYLAQIEGNQRPLTAPVLLRLNSALALPADAFDDENARLLSEVRAALNDPAISEQVSIAEVQEIASAMPAVGRAIAAMHRQLTRLNEQAGAFAARLEGDRQEPATPTVNLATPFEEVRDFFYTRRNHINALDQAAEATAGRLVSSGLHLHRALERLLFDEHGVRIKTGTDAASTKEQRAYDPATRTLRLSPRLRETQQAFQMATQLAFLSHEETISAELARTEFSSDAARTLARIGLANYFAGALILPYAAFLSAAEELRYDIDLLSQRFGVGFETICHRLSTLQRPGAEGVPFFFIRVDRAGNISKRQSATSFHFSRFGGTCPLWNVYEAFSSPGRILTQLAEMPDGRTYMWVARTVSRRIGGYGTPDKTFAIGLGCDIRHAERLVYSKGLRLDDREARTPIGMGCRICERPACPQRAFPSLTRPLAADERRSTFAPYAF